MQQAATDYPDVTFVACTGDLAACSGLDNYKNIFPYTYESRYVSGVVAGMKLKELMDAGTVTDPYVGYVGAFPYAEVVCGYTAFLLGIQSQVPEAHMDVQYTNSWYDPVAEGEAANALMARGCVIIGQHADSTGAPSAVQAQKDAGSVVYSVGYNIDMLSVAPTAALTSAQNNWSVLYRDTLEKFIDGEEVPADFAVGASEDAVMISNLGPECAEGTQEAVDAAWAGIKDGSLKVFDTSKFTCQPATDGSYQVDADGHVTSAFGLDSDGDYRQRHRRGHRGRRLPGVRPAVRAVLLPADRRHHRAEQQLKSPGRKGLPFGSPFLCNPPNSPPRHRPPGSFFPFLFPPEARAAGVLPAAMARTVTKRKDDLLGTYHCH